MSADIVNLRRARKAASRRKSEADAAANRASFGRSAAERTRAAAEGQQNAKHLDQHRLSPANPTNKDDTR
ncbi:MAG: hypothetical protein NVS2B5_19550 [Beijerinckiaceae bacterium]